MSAWSSKVLVIEAGGKSGSLITAQLAFEQGRQVLAVPNSIYSQESRGTNLLIAKGAEIYLNDRQLLLNDKKSFAAKTENKRTSAQVKKAGKRIRDSKKIFSPLEKELWELITEKPQHIEKLGLSFSSRLSFLETLSIMELEGKIKRLPGGMVCKT